MELNDLKSLARLDIPDAEVLGPDSRPVAFPIGCVVNSSRSWPMSAIPWPCVRRACSRRQFQAYAGLYSNGQGIQHNADLDARLEELILAIKQVYASTFYQAPKAFSRRVSQRT